MSGFSLRKRIYSDIKEVNFIHIEKVMLTQRGMISIILCTISGVFSCFKSGNSASHSNVDNFKLILWFMVFVITTVPDIPLKLSK